MFLRQSNWIWAYMVRSFLHSERRLLSRRKKYCRRNVVPPFLFYGFWFGTTQYEIAHWSQHLFLLLSALLSAITSFNWVTSSFCHHFNSCLLLSASLSRKLSSTYGGRSIAFVGCEGSSQESHLIQLLDFSLLFSGRGLCYISCFLFSFCFDKEFLFK